MNSIKAAYYILAFADSKGDLLTHKKLQKLLYYVQAWHLVYFEGDPLFHEQPQAWQHGPVYPSVYYKFKDFSYTPISISNEYSDSESSLDYLETLIAETGINARQCKLIESVMLKYGALTSFELEVLTHRETPWLEQRVGYGEFDRCTNEISHDSMSQYYTGLLKRQKKD